MSDRHGWERVNKQNPCPICEKPDWCLISLDGQASICPRTEGGIKYLGEAGYLHLTDEALEKKSRYHYVPYSKAFKTKDPPEGLNIAWRPMVQEYIDNRVTGHLNSFAESLGVSPHSLMRLEIGWTGTAWAFPMRNEHDTYIGIRLRTEDGKKFAVKGSRNGLFVPRGPETISITRPICITEGPTDTAAVLDQDYLAIGRASVNTCMEMTAHVIKNCPVVIFTDNDRIGREWSDRLAHMLYSHCPTVQVVTPWKGKDVRQWIVDHHPSPGALSAVINSVKCMGPKQPTEPDPVEVPVIDPSVIGPGPILF